MAYSVEKAPKELSFPEVRVLSMNGEIPWATYKLIEKAMFVEADGEYRPERLTPLARVNTKE